MQVGFCLQAPHVNPTPISLISKIVNLQINQLCRESWQIIRIALHLFYHDTFHDAESFAKLGGKGLCEIHIITYVLLHFFTVFSLSLLSLISLFRDFTWVTKLLLA